MKLSTPVPRNNTHIYTRWHNSCFNNYSEMPLFSLRKRETSIGVCSTALFLFDMVQCLNPFPHTTILQQTSLNIFFQKIENLFNWMDNLWLKVENIVAKGEIARFEQFLLLSLCFPKAVCCRGIRKHLYEG